MGLATLRLRDFRCFEAADLELSSGYNLILGGNGAGKTSILEAIFLLGRGRSFRASLLSPLVRKGAKGFQVAGRVWREPSSQATIRVERHKGVLTASLDGRRVLHLAELARVFPLQIVDSQAYHLVSGSPKQRRQFLDWGVFHVEPDFFPAWRRYHRALRQRNTLLRQGKPDREITSWDPELSETGSVLHACRERYLGGFSEKASEWAQRALGGLEVTLEYRQGWPATQTLSEALSTSLTRDKQMGSTQLGPHRSDILIRVAGEAAQDRISRGQEKVLAGTLFLAQLTTLRAVSGQQSTVLLDDLSAELDAGHLWRFLELADMTSSQVIITAIEEHPLLVQRAARVFHVEQGIIKGMV